MSRSDKAAAIAELSEKFRSSNAAVLTEYRGLTVKQLTELRSNLRGNATYAVVKNTLTELAAKDAGVDAFDGQLAGPSAIAFVEGDPVTVAKSLRDFAKANPLLVIKGGVLEGKALSAAEITKLADLESREVLLAKLAGAMNASLAKAVTLANRRKVGADDDFDQRQQPQQPAGANEHGYDRADVAQRFRSERAMDRHKLGNDTPNGVEVLDVSGKVIGHYR